MKSRIKPPPAASVKDRDNQPTEQARRVPGPSVADSAKDRPDTPPALGSSQPQTTETAHGEVALPQRVTKSDEQIRRGMVWQVFKERCGAVDPVRDPRSVTVLARDCYKEAVTMVDVWFKCCKEGV